jgi:K+-transporting ATPase KdpF subunit
VSSVSSRSGASPSPAIAPEELPMFDYIVSGIVSLLLLVYLGWAMFQPEKF